MKKKSAGLLMYHFNNGALELLLGHMGGPFWEKKDEAAWSIFKGEFADDENPFDAAKREFLEETGIEPVGDFIELTVIKQPSGKLVHAWAFEGNCDASAVKSNTFEMEWPPRSGIIRSFPEIDRARWFTAASARKKIVKGQVGFIDELCKLLNSD
jgi:predicted NUDIX family NTP pyrophosphohydrolase